MPDKKEAGSDVRIFNPQTGAFETGHEAAQMHSSPDPVAEHMAQIEGDVAPGDRTAEELAGLDPADVGPVVTAGSPTVAASQDAGVPGATGGAARGGTATGGRAAAGGGGTSGSASGS